MTRPVIYEEGEMKEQKKNIVIDIFLIGRPTFDSPSWNAIMG